MPCVAEFCLFSFDGFLAMEPDVAMKLAFLATKHNQEYAALIVACSLYNPSPDWCGSLTWPLTWHLPGVATCCGLGLVEYDAILFDPSSVTGTCCRQESLIVYYDIPIVGELTKR